MPDEPVQRKINWYRSPLDRETLAALNQRSDFQGLLQVSGHLGLLLVTGATAWVVAMYWTWPWILLALFIHGTFYAFLLNGFHELCHKTVFKTKALNTIFLYVISFLSWNNPVRFWTSHQRHHRYTLHPPDDLEVMLPVELSFKAFLQCAVVNPFGLYSRIRSCLRLSFGRLEGEWEHILFPPAEAELRRELFNWSRILLVGHGLLVTISLALGLWMLPVVITLAPFYGGWLLYLVNNTQHAGLQDNVSDYRLCCWTVILNPFLSFVYWRMNFHTEHHMYAAVPCYHLKKLHEHIRTDLPYCPVGLWEAWKLIIAILKKQKEDPTYQYAAELPVQVEGPVV